MTKENNKVDINKHEMDIGTLKKQNVNDLLSIKELYSKLEELGEKITQFKYIDNTLVKKLKKEYENLKKIILDENIQVQLDNKIDEFNLKLTHDIETINSQLTHDIETINSQLTNDIETINEKLTNDIGTINSQLVSIAIQIMPTMSTSEIQNLLNTYNNFLWNSGTYNINPIFLKSNQYHRFAPNVILQAKPGFLTNDCLLNLIGISNVVIDFNNAKLNMNFAEYTTGEWRHCLNLKGVSNVNIKNVYCYGAGGDGIYIGTNGDGKYSENVNFDNINIDKCRRQGISIVSVSRCYINNAYISNIKGTPPAFGIDIEPNNPLDKIEGVVLSNINTFNCDGGGIAFCLDKISHSGSYTDNINNIIDVKINNYTSDGDFFGLSFYPNYYKVNGNIEINKIKVINSKQNGIYSCEWYSSLTPNVKINDLLIQNCNTSNNSSQTLGSGIVHFSPVGKKTEDIGNITFNNVSIIDTRTTKQMKNGVFSYNNTKSKGVFIELNNIYVDGVLNNLISVDGSLKNKNDNDIVKVCTTNTAIVGNLDYKTVYTNIGAASDVQISLALKNVGETVDIEVGEDGKYIKTYANPNTGIIVTKNGDVTGAGVYYQSNKVGSRIKIKKVSANKYVVLNECGFWEKSKV